jgi:hypothetical protein
MKLQKIVMSLITLMAYFTVQAQCVLNTEYTNTGSNMTIFITPVAANDLAEIGNGIVAAYFSNTTGEVCGGSMEVFGEQTSFPVMADDATTIYKDGFSNGDEVVLKYITESGNVYSLQPEPNDYFTTNAISFVTHFTSTLICGDDEVIEGCTDPNFVEYNPEATLDDGSCHNWIVEGCIMDGYLEYNPQANIDDGSCLTPIIYGCTNIEALNYNAEANTEDGSCEYDSNEASCDFNFENINTGANHTIIIPEGVSDFLNVGDEIGVYYTSVSGELKGSGYSNWTSNTMQIVAYGDDVTTPQIDGFSSGENLNFIARSNGVIYTVSAEFQQDNMSVYAANGISFVTSLEFEMLCDSEVENGGCMDASACNYNPDANYDDGSCEYVQANVSLNIEYGAANWGGQISNSIVGEFIDIDLACETISNDIEGKIALIQRGECQFSLKALNAQAAGAIAVVIYNHNGGIMNMGAGNYSSEVQIPVVMISNNDGVELVELLANGTTLQVDLSNSGLNVSNNQMYDCEGNCISDIDQDGICDEDEIMGCTDNNACNFNSTATDNDGSCEYALEYLDCEGNCVNDADGDGICDENEVFGCTDVEAENYNVDATDEDGSCEYILGCTDADANNYNELATQDDGSCEYASSCGCTDDSYAEYYTQGFIADCDNGSCATLTMDLGLSQTHFQTPFNSSVNMTVGFELPEMSGLDGAVLAAFYDINGDGELNSSSNECVGYIPFENEFFVMSIWGDDPLSDELDGTPVGATDVVFAVLLTNGTVMAFNPIPEFQGFDSNELIVVNELDFDVTIYGCTDSSYCNYNPEAEEDDGSCEGLFGCTEEMYVEYDLSASCQLDEACITTWQSAFVSEQEQNAALENEIYILGESIVELESSLASQVDVNNVLEGELQEANALIEDYEGSLESANQTILELENQVVELSNIISELELNLSSANIANQQLQEEFESVQESLAIVQSQLNELQVVNQELEQSLLIANQLNSENEIEISTLNEELGLANNTIEELQQNIIDIYNESEASLNECNEEAFALQNQIEELLLENSNLLASNDSIGSPIEIDLIDGWNIIGYTLKTPQDAVATFSEIVDEIGVVKNNAAQVYWPDYGFNGIGDLIPGQGYQIRMYADVPGFTYPNVGGQRIEIQPTVPQWAIDMPVEIHPNDIRTLVKVVNQLGQEVVPENEFKGEILYYLYNDGTVEKKLN